LLNLQDLANLFQDVQLSNILSKQFLIYTKPLFYARHSKNKHGRARHADCGAFEAYVCAFRILKQ
jgi:hypothetical protein